jgi:hypothetical protein
MLIVVVTAEHGPLDAAELALTSGVKCTAAGSTARWGVAGPQPDVANIQAQPSKSATVLLTTSPPTLGAGNGQRAPNAGSAVRPPP